MIYVRAGASHTGKTLLAQKLLEKLKIPYLSIDHLKMGLIRSAYTNLTPEDDDKLTDYLWPVVREIIKTAIENKQNLIVEGCYISFGWRHDFEEHYASQIKFVCLAMAESYIDAHFDEIKNHADDIEARLDDSALSLDWLKKENQAAVSGFRKAGEKILLIECDYDKAINRLIEEFC